MSERLSSSSSSNTRVSDNRKVLKDVMLVVIDIMWLRGDQEYVVVETVGVVVLYINSDGRRNHSRRRAGEIYLRMSNMRYFFFTELDVLYGKIFISGAHSV